MKDIKLKDMNLSIEDIIELLDNEKDGYKYESSISRPNQHDFKIVIKKVIQPCFICKDEFHINKLFVRQDTRVTALFLPKKVCKSCCINLDDVLGRLKIKAIPRHLSQLK